MPDSWAGQGIMHSAASFPNLVALCCIFSSTWSPTIASIRRDNVVMISDKIFVGCGCDGR